MGGGKSINQKFGFASFMDEPNVIPLNGISTLNGYSIPKCDVISHHENVLFQELTTILCVNDTNNNFNVFSRENGRYHKYWLTGFQL